MMVSREGVRRCQCYGSAPGMAKLALPLRGGKPDGACRSRCRAGPAAFAARGAGEGGGDQIALSIIWVSRVLMFGGAPSWLEWTWPSLNISSIGMLRTL